MPRVKIVREGSEPVLHEFDEELLIGRDKNNHVSLADPATSRHHAVIRREGAQMVLSDLASNNGTFANGRKVHRHVLAHGDRVQVGKTLMLFEDDAAKDRATVILQEDRVEPKAKATRAAGAEQPVSRIRELYELLRRLSGSLEEREILTTLCEVVGDPMRADVVAAVAAGGEVVHTGRREARISRSLVLTAVGTGEAALYGGTELAGSVSVIEEKIASVLCAPIVVDGRAEWVLYADRRRDGEAFGEEDLDFANAAAATAAVALRNATIYGASQREAQQLRRIHADSGRLIGRNAKFRESIDVATKAASTDSNVIVLGESGTGKELLARHVHERGGRAKGPFIAINCAAIPETLLESELFGHEKGAFTGATRAQPGKFEIAAGGTLFLDEIAELDVSLQAKLLRAIQEKQFYRVGGKEPVRSDARIIAATNCDIDAAVKDGRVRQDLYYRLAVITITLPPLRDRKEDIPLLAQHFLALYAEQMKKSIGAVDPKAMERLQSYGWPGNVRELQNVIERAVVLSEGGALSPELFPSGGGPEETTFDLAEMEKRTILRALEATGGKKGEAIKLLGISWPTLNKKLKSYGLE
jgi:DNA-binding NtrC family response regulator